MGRNRVNRNTKSAEIMQLKFGLAHHVIAKESLHRFGVLCMVFVYCSASLGTNGKCISSHSLILSHSYLANTADSQVAL